MNSALTDLTAFDGSQEQFVALEAILTERIVGKKYLFAKPTYGDELTLHFGEETEHRQPKLAGTYRGTHVLSVRGSAWLLQSGTRPVMIGCGLIPTIGTPGKPFNVTALESGAMISSGATVVKADTVVAASDSAAAIGLKLTFSDGSSFIVIPTPPADDLDGLPHPSDWELLSPEGVLRVGPGLTHRLETN